MLLDRTLNLTQLEFDIPLSLSDYLPGQIIYLPSRNTGLIAVHVQPLSPFSLYGSGMNLSAVNAGLP